jgi:NRPS condensation-like uncharacterized protein
VTRPARAVRHPAGSRSADATRPEAVALNMTVSSTGPPRDRFGVADELAWYYDAPGEPSNVHLEARLPVHLDGAALRRAVAAALAAQSRARVRRAPGGWWRRGQVWELPAVPDLDPVTAVTWADDGELARERERFLAAAPPLELSPPVRVLLAAGPGEDRVILNAHHSALDGLSCLELLRSIARHYPGGGGTGATAAGAAGRDGTAAGRDGTAAGRDGTAAGRDRAAEGRDGAAGARDGAAGGRRGPVRWPAPIARIAADRDEDAGPDGSVFLLLPPRPVPSGRPGRATVNDVLIAALIAAIGRWNAAHARPAAPIRITMPVDSRPPGQAGTAGNLSRLTAVTARAPGPDLGGLVADVARQTRSAKDRPGPQVDPVSRALAAAPCPGPVKRRLLRLGLRTAGPLLCDTSLVSNLGVVANPPRFAGAAATGLWFSTSAHMPRGLSVGAVTIGGRLHLCLRCRRALFGEAAAARFAGAYACALDEITAAGRPR